ncbi:MAG: hypothetical protein K6D54_06860 [Bacteroidales bacterium]|nr:hypothetical protein [Bacteroidales bacterium]
MNSFCIFHSQCLIALLIIGGCAEHSPQIERPLFVYKELQDSVERFVSEIAPIDNPYGFPTLTLVSFDLIQGDTLIFIRPGLTPYVSERDSVLGANMLGGRICEVAISKTIQINHFSDVIDESALMIPQCYYNPLFITSTENYEKSECDYQTVLSLARISRVYVMCRPNHLRLIAKDGVSIH